MFWDLALRLCGRTLLTVGRPLMHCALQARTKDLRFGRSPVHAWGLFARTAIPKEEFVVEYVGETIRSSLEDLREQEYERSGLGSSYLFRVDRDTVVDATKKVNPVFNNLLDVLTNVSKFDRTILHLQGPTPYNLNCHTSGFPKISRCQVYKVYNCLLKVQHSLAHKIQFPDPCPMQLCIYASRAMCCCPSRRPPASAGWAGKVHQPQL